jgi:hypothetical protein
MGVPLPIGGRVRLYSREGAAHRAAGGVAAIRLRSFL